MGHYFLSEPNFQRCPIAACAKERGCGVPEKNGKVRVNAILWSSRKGKKRME